VEQWGQWSGDDGWVEGVEAYGIDGAARYMLARAMVRWWEGGCNGGGQAEMKVDADHSYL
jgi:hypothetical protein